MRSLCLQAVAEMDRVPVQLDMVRCSPNSVRASTVRANQMTLVPIVTTDYVTSHLSVITCFTCLVLCDHCLLVTLVGVKEDKGGVRFD